MWLNWIELNRICKICFWCVFNVIQYNALYCNQLSTFIQYPPWDQPHRSWTNYVSTFFYVNCLKFRPHFLKIMLRSMVKFPARPQNCVYLTHVHVNNSTKQQQKQQKPIRWDQMIKQNRRQQEKRIPAPYASRASPTCKPETVKVWHFLASRSASLSNILVFSLETHNTLSPYYRTPLPRPALRSVFHSPKSPFSHRISTSLFQNKNYSAIQLK